MLPHTIGGDRTVRIDDEEDMRMYNVVVNDEDQYSIWPADEEIPKGWMNVGKMGPKADCLAYVKDAWTDMTPRSLREQIKGSTTRSAEPAK